MKQKLYDLKIQLLKAKIKDSLKLELIEQVLQIEKDLTINYTRCSLQLLCRINGWENITLDKKYTMLFEDEAMYGFRNDINEIVERNKQHFELLKQ